MSDLSLSKNPERCPYCGQPIGGDQREQIREMEESRTENLRREERKKVEEEMGAIVEEQLQAKTREIQNQYEQAVREKSKKLEAAQKTIEGLTRKLEDKSAPTLGGIQEDQLVQMLQSEFPGDRIERISGAGPDIKHEIFLDGESCGVIVYESKNVQNWQSSFITKLRNDKRDSGATYAILVSTAFPANSKDFTVVEGIPIVSPGLLVHLVKVVRESLVDLKKGSFLAKDTGRKFEQLLIFLESPDFKNRMESLFVAVNRLEQLQDREKRAHEKTWKDQAVQHKSIVSATKDVEFEIDSIISGR